VKYNTGVIPVLGLQDKKADVVRNGLVGKSFRETQIRPVKKAVIKLFLKYFTGNKVIHFKGKPE
jgi:hypothetical protein